MDSHQIFLDNKFNAIKRFIKPNSKILDIGCNDGKIMRFFENPKYYGIDIDKDLIFQLKEQGINAKVVDLNKDAIPFEDIEFDYLLLLDVLEHIIDPRKLLSDIKKRINESSKILITLPNDYHILNKIRFLLNGYLTQDPFAPYGHLHYFPIKTGEKLLKSSGFKILKKIPISPEKPNFLTRNIKNFLSKTFPQSFARDILYVLSV